MQPLAVAVCAVFVASTGARVSAQNAPAPVVSVWYRGTPSGVPKLDDLAALRVAGFVSVTWPAAHAGGLAELRRLAAIVDLQVVTETTASVPVASAGPNLAGLLWRAIAQGARVVAVDPGQTEGTGMNARAGALRPWVAQAAAVSRQVSANPQLMAALRPGPRVTVDATGRHGVEVALLDGDRAWLLVATSTAPGPSAVVARLPAGVPSALWVSLIDGSGLSMLRQSSGARWTFTIGAGDALVYVIDKTLK